MANPTPFAPSYDFSDFAARNPATPLPGDQVDIQFSAIQRTTDQTITALSDIRRSDGKLKNGVVTPDSLSAGLVMGFTVEGEWTNGAEYGAADGVSYGTSFYKARVAHTASPSTRPDLSPDTWAFLFTFDSLAIGDNSVTTVKIVNSAVTEAKIADGAVTEAKIGTGAVTSAKIATDAITTPKIADAQVTAGKLAPDAVTTSKIVDANVTAAKIASGAVTTAKIADAQVTSAKLDAGAVTASKIAAGAVVETLVIPVTGEAETVTTGAAKRTFRMPYPFVLTAVRASLATASSSGLPTVDINENGVSVLSTKLTIDASEKTSVTAATPAVISDSAINDDAEITIDVDVAGTGAKGLKVTMIGYRA